MLVKTGGTTGDSDGALVKIRGGDGALLEEIEGGTVAITGN